MHAACLASFVRLGHRTRLHAFDAIEDVPPGVELFDATQLMASHEIFRHEGHASLALTADIYRLRILRENLGIYVDCDVYCLQPFPDAAYLFGWEDKFIINNAVLGMPADSKLLRALLRDAENPKFIPPRAGLRIWPKLRMRQLIGTADTRPHLPWASLGPHLLTHHVKRLGLQGLAQDIDIFYPLIYTHTPLLNQAGLRLEDLTTRRSLALHLWNATNNFDEIQPGSTLDQIVRSHAAREDASVADNR